MTTEGSTPPHHPTHDVHISPGRINSIVSTLYPNHVTEIVEAPRGTSYNNRIYFLTISPNKSPSIPPHTPSPPQAVLKLSGHFFNHTKVQNEVASLLLLAQHCPEVPAPLVLAWSDDGRTISTRQKSMADASHVEGGEGDGRGWILMTRLPGRTLTTADLDGPSGGRLLKQIATHNASWRTNIPSVRAFGNIHHMTPEELKLGELDPGQVTPVAQNYTVGGFLLCHRYDPAPIKTLLGYFIYMLTDQLHRVMTSPAYDEVKGDLVPLVTDFLDNDLRHLSLLNPQQGDGGTGTFSHMDLAPRNILVRETDGHGLHVSGMVDFEFAAFLPAGDEFVNTCVRQEGDWEPRHYEALVRELANLNLGGVKVPPLDGVQHADASFTQREWREMCALWRLIDNVAPWYIMDGKMGYPELQDELRKARGVVEGCIAELQQHRLADLQTDP